MRYGMFGGGVVRILLVMMRSMFMRVVTRMAMTVLMSMTFFRLSMIVKCA